MSSTNSKLLLPIVYTPPLTNNKNFRGRLVAIMAMYTHHLKETALPLVPVVTNARKLATFQLSAEVLVLPKQTRWI